MGRGDSTDLLLGRQTHRAPSAEVSLSDEALTREARIFVERLSSDPDKALKKLIQLGYLQRSTPVSDLLVEKLVVNKVKSVYPGVLQAGTAEVRRLVKERLSYANFNTASVSQALLIADSPSERALDILEHEITIQNLNPTLAWAWANDDLTEDVIEKISSIILSHANSLFFSLYLRMKAASTRSRVIVEDERCVRHISKDVIPLSSREAEVEARLACNESKTVTCSHVGEWHERNKLCAGCEKRATDYLSWECDDLEMPHYSPNIREGLLTAQHAAKFSLQKKLQQGIPYTPHLIGECLDEVLHDGDLGNIMHEINSLRPDGPLTHVYGMPLKGEDSVDFLRAYLLSLTKPQVMTEWMKQQTKKVANG